LSEGCGTALTGPDRLCPLRCDERLCQAEIIMNRIFMTSPEHGVNGLDIDVWAFKKSSKK